MLGRSFLCEQPCKSLSYSGDLAKDLARACRVVIPIKRIEIRKSEVLKAGEGEPESIMPAVEPVAEEEAPAESEEAPAAEPEAE